MTFLVSKPQLLLITPKSAIRLDALLSSKMLTLHALVERGIDCPIHVDAASGGFVAPFVVPELEWDFRCEKVVSINASGHKVMRLRCQSWLYG